MTRAEANASVSERFGLPLTTVAAWPSRTPMTDRSCEGCGTTFRCVPDADLYHCEHCFAELDPTAVSPLSMPWTHIEIDPDEPLRRLRDDTEPILSSDRDTREHDTEPCGPP